MKMLESINATIEGRHALVLGRSNMVGKPMAMLLLAANATVTIAHSKTRPRLVRHAPPTSWSPRWPAQSGDCGDGEAGSDSDRCRHQPDT